MLRNLILLGAPGGGKGTIAKKIMKDFPFLSVNSLLPG
jgi:adenylate kinase family enzyme